MADKITLISNTLTNHAPSFDRVFELMQESGVEISPSDYISACKSHNMVPDIDQVFIKIAESTATIEDLNMLLEDVGDAVRERILRRTRKNVTKGHQTHGGHQKLSGPNVAGRTTPKRKRSGHTQSHGRGKHGHDRSTNTQRQNARSQ